MSGPSPHVTTLLLAWGNGDEHALDELIPLVHRELRRMAQRAMAGEHAGHTLQPTALVNEVYLRLVDIKSVQWNNRAHFFALSARLMRRILVDLARSKRYEKRGGGVQTIVTRRRPDTGAERTKDLVALDEALQRWRARSSPEPGRRTALLRGAGVEETAEVLNVSRQTVMRDWTLARTWLFRELRSTPPKRKPQS